MKIILVYTAHAYSPEKINISYTYLLNRNSIYIPFYLNHLSAVSESTINFYVEIETESQKGIAG